jgi:hypothetical protein
VQIIPYSTGAKSTSGEAAGAITQAANTHATLPSALQRLQQAHWEQLGRQVIKAIQCEQIPDFLFIVNIHFYQDVYEKASSDIDYEFSEAEEARQEEWATLVNFVVNNPECQPAENSHGKCHVQFDFDFPDDIQLAKLCISYHTDIQECLLQSRLQFVVTSEAGSALYYDLAQLMNQYIDEVCHGDPQHTPVQFFKVYSEDAQLGRSDSAVFYLTAPLSDPRVQQLARYLDYAIGHRFAPVEIIGASSVEDSYVQGITIPDRSLQRKVTGNETGSHGELIQSILIRAFQTAYQDAFNKGEIELTTLVQSAQIYAARIWNKLRL